MIAAEADWDGTTLASLIEALAALRAAGAPDGAELVFSGPKVKAVWPS